MRSPYALAKRKSSSVVRNRSSLPFSSKYDVTALTSPFFGQSSMVQEMEAYGAVGTLFAIVSGLATSTAQWDWMLYRDSVDRRRVYGPNDTERTEIVTHPALALWNNPNPFYSQGEFIETCQQHLDLTGECWWVVTKAGGMPIGLWPVRPDRMDVVRDPEKFISGYVYMSPDGERIPLKLDEVIHIRMPSPLDPYRGMGPVQTILADLQGVQLSSEWNRNFFLNSAEPGGIIEVPAELNEAEFEKMRRRWASQHQGVSNAHRVAIIEEAKWVDRKITQRDMQFVELRKAQSETIREAYRYPTPMLGTVESVNRANAEAAEVFYGRWLIQPRLERFADALNGPYLKLFGASGQGVIFDHENCIPDDRAADAADLTAKSQAAVALVGAGFEAKAVLETCKLPDMPYTKPAVPAPVVAPGAPGGGSDGGANTPPGNRYLSGALNGLKAITAAIDSPRTLMLEDEARALDALESAWKKITVGQIKDLVDQIADGADIQRTLKPKSDDGAELLRTHLSATAASGAQRMIDEAAQQDVNVEMPTFARYVNSASGIRMKIHAKELKTVANALAANLATELGAAASGEALRLWKPGEKASELASKVGDYLSGLVGAARRLSFGAVLHRATNLGRLAVLDLAPAAAVYVAIEEDDKNTCKPCKEIDGTEWPDMHEAWSIYATGGYNECLGKSRCRGTVSARWEDAS